MTPSPPSIRSERRGGFALVLSLTVMAALLLTVLSLAAILTLEARVGRASILQKRARLNAIAGARIALGELQRTLGPDQRVSATADILCAPEKPDPTRDDYYQGPAGLVRHPRWVGVWNAGAVPGATGDTAAAGERNRVIPRTIHGYLVDSRFAQGAQWENDRASTTSSQNSPRLVTWLVSGNEAITSHDPSFLSPYDTPDETVPLLGEGILGKLFDNATPLMDKLGARARRISMGSGGYAYWVSDEGVKARFNLTDPVADAGKAPDPSSPNDGGYTRLLIPRKNRFDNVRATTPGAADLPKDDIAGREAISGFDSPGLTLTHDEAFALRAHYLHDVTFVSAGVLSDVAHGGLKKDLSVYLDSGTDIPDGLGIAGSGLAGSDRMLTDATLAAASPTFSLLRDWWANAPRMSATPPGSAGVPARGPVTYTKNYLQNIRRNTASLTQSFNAAIPDYAQQTKAAFAPVVVEMSTYCRTASDDFTPDPANERQARVLVYPRIAIWNPYPVPMRLNRLRFDHFNWYAWVPALTTWGQGLYTGIRPWTTYRFPQNVVLAPGQSKMFVADRTLNDTRADPPHGVEESADMAFKARDVYLKEGLPAPDCYYVNSLVSGAGTSRYPKPAAGYGLGIQRRLWNLGCDTAWFGSWLFKTGSEYRYDETRITQNQLFVSTDDGATPLLQVNLDNQGGPASQQARGISGTTEWGAISLKNNIATPIPPANYVNNSLMGFRLKRLDPDESNVGRTLTLSPMVDANVRATRQTRYPFDAADIPTGYNLIRSGVWTTDPDLNFYSLVLYPPTAAEISPLFSPRSILNYSAYPACIPYDIPFADVGLFSLAQLRHAPLNAFPYGPSMPFSNGRIPVPDTGGGITDSAMISRTGLTASEISAAWKSLSKDGERWSNLDKQVRQLDRLGQNTHDIFDIAFELNNALWDRYWLSAIPQSNTGRGAANAPWENKPFDGSGFAHTLPDSRLIPTGRYPENSGYFASDNYKLYKPAHTLLQRGAFNVNSTSKVAWRSLLASGRDIRIPSLDGGGASAGTPFPRLLRPKSGPSPNSTKTNEAFAEETWSGYRVLTDEELDKLADKIVAEVKRRGPFLSLSDFVNRRLRSPDYADWSVNEAKFLGTLESAIQAAGLNAQFGNAEMPRGDKDKDDLPVSQQVPRKPEHRSAHKIAGAPGYLEQGDILQSIGEVLTARSDTFVIRARGDCEGAVACVELTVQRFPEPLFPGDGSNALPVNPKAVTTEASKDYAGNQFFGRRMRVVALRNLNESDI